MIEQFSLVWWLSVVLAACVFNAVYSLIFLVVMFLGRKWQRLDHPEIGSGAAGAQKQGSVRDIANQQFSEGKS